MMHGIFDWVCARLARPQHPAPLPLLLFSCPMCMLYITDCVMCRHWHCWFAHHNRHTSVLPERWNGTRKQQGQHYCGIFIYIKGIKGYHLVRIVFYSCLLWMFEYYTLIQFLSHWNVHTQTYSCMGNHMHINKHCHAHTTLHMHTNKHKQRQIHTHTHTHTHTQTHTDNRNQ